MALGRFGSSAPRIGGVSGFTGGGDAGDSGVEESRRLLSQPREGDPTDPSQLALRVAGYGQNILRGGGFEAYDASTDPPIGWTRTGTGVSSSRSTTNVKEGTYAAQLTNGANNSADYRQTITVSSTVNEDLRGNPVTLSCWVYATTADRVSLRIDDGVQTKDSVFHQGGSRFELLTVTHVMDAAATQLRVLLQISAGAAIAVLFDAAMLVRGSSAVGFSKHPNDEHLRVSSFNARTDVGVYRCEIEDDASSAVADVTVTFTEAYPFTPHFFDAVPIHTALAHYGARFANVGASSLDVAIMDDASGRVAVTFRTLVIGQG